MTSVEREEPHGHAVATRLVSGARGINPEERCCKAEAQRAQQTALSPQPGSSHLPASPWAGTTTGKLACRGRSGGAAGASPPYSQVWRVGVSGRPAAPTLCWIRPRLPEPRARRVGRHLALPLLHLPGRNGARLQTKTRCLAAAAAAEPGGSHRRGAAVRCRGAPRWTASPLLRGTLVATPPG